MNNELTAIKDRKKNQISKKSDRILKIGSVCNGELIDITKIRNMVVPEKFLGTGAAILPNDGKIYAPISCEITEIALSEHAISICSEQGHNLLIQIGIDAIKSNGEYFTTFHKVGDKVHKGELLAEYNIGKLMEQGYDLVTLLILTNADMYFDIFTENSKDIYVGDTVIIVIN